jgi:hypothetical protein
MTDRLMGKQLNAEAMNCLGPLGGAAPAVEAAVTTTLVAVAAAAVGAKASDAGDETVPIGRAVPLQPPLRMTMSGSSIHIQVW